MANRNLKCPRCDSSDTKFSYFNNYNPSQPRHLCKTCRRKWTVGGAIRDIPRRERHTIIASSSSASAVAPPPPQSLSQEVVANQSVSSPPDLISQLLNQLLNGDTANAMASSDLAILHEWLCSQPIGYAYHQGSGGGLGTFYLSALAGVQSPNASSQAPFNQSLNGDGFNFGVATNSGSSSTLAPQQSLIQNQLVSSALPVTNTYHPSSVGGEAQAGYFTSLTGFQPINGGGVDFVVSNQATNYSSSSTLEPPQLLVQSPLVGPSLPTINPYDHGIVGGGALAGSLNGGVSGVGSSDLVLQSDFNAAGTSHYPRIESLYDQGFIQPSVGDNNVVAAVSHYHDQWPQSFINTDNNVAASNAVLWDDMFGMTSNISGGNFDENFTMPNHGPGLPGYGTPPPPQN